MEKEEYCSKCLIKWEGWEKIKEILKQVYDKVGSIGVG
jgi:hypothetical protein